MNPAPILNKPPARYRWLAAVWWPLWVAHALWLAVREKESRYFWQRLGLGVKPSQARLWVHASSVGEINSLLPLLRQWLEKHPDAGLFCSTYTITGARTLRQKLPEVEQAYLPIDHPWLLRLWLRNQAFEGLAIMETELWPWCLHQSRAQNIKTVLINARLSNKSYRPQSWFHPVLKYAANQLDQIWTRSELDQQRFESLLEHSARTKLVGNLKLAPNLPETHPGHPLQHRSFVLCASTHENEEQQIITALQKQSLAAVLVLAPRHPKRCEQIAEMIQAAGFNLLRHSQARADVEIPQVYLIDSLGQLPAFYAHAKAVFMGGSLNQVGGHNLYEAAAWNCALLSGPNMNNVAEDYARFRATDALLTVHSGEQLISEFKRLLDDPITRQNLQLNALELVLQSQKILDDYLSLLQDFMNAARPD